MTANEPMTGEQLDELMTVAVNMQRDSETAGDRPSAMFAYAVQVAVLELRKVLNDSAALEHKLAESQREFRAADATIENMQMQVEKLAAENAGLKNALEWLYETVSSESVSVPDEKYSSVTNAAQVLSETPATDAFLAEVRVQAKADGVQEYADSFRHSASKIRECHGDTIRVRALLHEASNADEFAAQLRKGVQS